MLSIYRRKYKHFILRFWHSEKKLKHERWFHAAQPINYNIQFKCFENSANCVSGARIDNDNYYRQ